MKKTAVYLSALACLLTGCVQEIRDKYVENKAQEAFSMFWNDLDSNYVFFDENLKNWDSSYTKWTKILEGAVEDNIRDLADSLVQEMADIQTSVSAGPLISYEYSGADSILSKYQGSCCGWRGGYPRWKDNTDPYIFIGGEQHFTGATIYTFRRNGDTISAPYLYIMPGMPGWGSTLQNNNAFWQEKITLYATHHKGVVLDIRGVNRLQWDDMLELLRYFIPQGANTIFYTRQRDHSTNERTTYTAAEPYKLEGYGTFANVPLCLIFDVYTQNEANIMAYILSSMHPKITSISMNYTLGGGGIRTTHKYITKDESFGFVASYPTIRLSNEKYTSFHAPLYPDISIPFEEFVYNRRGMIDRCLVVSMDVLDSQNNDSE